jgi:penicillin-binding protein 1C
VKKIIKIISIVLIIIAIPAVAFWIWSGYAVNGLITAYESRESNIVQDRNNQIIYVSQNSDDFYAIYVDEIPRDLADALIEKEDKYFYYHPGINPVSTLRAVWDKVVYKENRAQSTITQQLAKILLGNEQERTLGNKAQELAYAFALEARLTKDEILEMYLNSIYFGNQVQGAEMASKLYFDRSPEQLDRSQMVQLIASISSPSKINPFMSENDEEAEKLARRLEFDDLDFHIFPRQEVTQKTNNFKEFVSQDTYFEYKNFLNACTDEIVCTTSLDSELSDKIRTVINEHLVTLSKDYAQHAAVIIIKFPENELIASVGSPDPHSDLSGDQINMTMQPRPIGSTVKPFLYAKGFSEGLRPYTLVDDREYKYTTAAGFAHYPKNYDYTYQGIVTLHKSLSNSLNVPTVKVLEFIGLEDFYAFLLDELQIEPVQPLENYQYGIALGHLEMTLLDLSHRFTIFAQEGRLRSLQIAIPHEGICMCPQKMWRLKQELHVNIMTAGQ